jgi:hypothetical protein
MPKWRRGVRKFFEICQNGGAAYANFLNLTNGGAARPRLLWIYCNRAASIKHCIKPGKGKDVYNCCGEHFIFASGVIAAPVAEMLSHFLKVGSLPQSLACNIFFPIFKEKVLITEVLLLPLLCVAYLRPLLKLGIKTAF